MTKAAHRPVAWLGVALAACGALWLSGCGQGSGPARAAGDAGTSVWTAPAVPAAVRAAIDEAVAGGPRRLAAARSPREAEMRVEVRRAGRRSLAEVVLVPVVPFPTIADDVSWAAIRRFWRGRGVGLAAVTGDGSVPTLHLTPAMRATLTALLGRPAPAAPIRTVPAARLLDAAWDASPAGWSIVPFDKLRPRWKALTVDGRNVLDRRLRVGRWPLVARVHATGPPARVAELRRSIARAGARTNRDPGRMTTVMMTGVTALSRGIAARMDANGATYPAERIRHILRANDLLHISNEVSFTGRCPGPQRGTTFCSRPGYIELLEDVGTDIVELSGNHNLDYGEEPARETLAMYRRRGWRWFAGGRDHVEARRPLRITHNGNRLAFLGCNPVGAAYAWAGAGRPGAATCDEAAMRRQVRHLRSRGYLPIVTFQHWESYQYAPTGRQIEDFGAMSAAGAAIVSGSQAHQPQGFAFDGGRLVHYGLGNLFFDQMQTLGTRQEIVDRHVFYDGRHLSTQLVTFLLEDYSQPRPTTPAERAQLLGSVFAASPW
jgi:poly-gamma-glutamate synthesis protein (capsule biosynthesis protein)